MLPLVPGEHNAAWLTDKVGDKSNKLLRSLPETNHHPKVVSDDTALVPIPQSLTQQEQIMTSMLEGKIAIITGAARGLGQMFSRELARAGAVVVAIDRNNCSETIGKIEQDDNRAIFYQTDVADHKSLQDMAKKVTRDFGRIDILVNNAALYANLTSAPFDQLTEEEWDDCMRVNVKGVWNACRAVVPAMRKSGGGTIINMSSLAATYGLPFALHYTASKAAVIGITRGLARELGRHWIRVNAIAPSAVATEGTREFFGDKFEHATEVIRTTQSLRRTLEPSDVVGQVLYLASDASRFVTGQTLMVDGGTTLL